VGYLGTLTLEAVKTIKTGCGCCRLFGLQWKYQRWLQGVRCGYFNPNNAVVVVDGIAQSIRKDLNLMTLSSR
jgi:hypothetical protein